MNDKMIDNTHCTITLSFRELHMITAILLKYNEKITGEKLPLEINNDKLMKQFNDLTNIQKLEIFQSCMEEFQRGVHKVKLDIMLQIKGHKQSSQGE